MVNVDDPMDLNLIAVNSQNELPSLLSAPAGLVNFLGSESRQHGQNHQNTSLQLAQIPTPSYKFSVSSKIRISHPIRVASKRS
jgi:hypothetical protein